MHGREKILRIGLSVLVVGLVGCAAPAADAPDEPAEESSKSLSPWDPSVSDLELTTSLEEEYWQILGQEGAPGLPSWVWRARTSQLVRGKERLPRVSLLLAVACLRPVGGGNFLGLPNCFAYATDAVDNYGTENSYTVYHALHAYRAMALGQRESALEHLELAQERGGVEGRVVAAYGYAMFRDRELVRRALDVLEDCEGDACNETSSLSDYKKVIMLMVLAEVHAKLGNTTEMNDAFDRARAEAERLDWPFAHALPDMERTIIENGEAWNDDSWSLSPGSIGLIELPTPSFNEPQMCTYCHRGAELKGLSSP